MDPEADNPLRVVIPDLVPDPEFVGLLAARAAASRGSTMPPPLAFPGLGVRVAAAAAGVVLVIAGAAITAANLAGDDSAPAPTVPAPSPTEGEQGPADARRPPRNASSPKPPVDRGGPPAGTLDEGPDNSGPSPSPSASPGTSDLPETCEEWLVWAEDRGYIDDADDYDCDEIRDQYRDRDWDRGWGRDRDHHAGHRNNDDWDGSPRWQGIQ
jgi:hypothetical protein